MQCSVLLLTSHIAECGSHATPPYCCVIQVFTVVAWQPETCLPQHCIATFTVQLSLRRKHCFLLLLRNGHVYRGAAYELPEQIRYNIIQNNV
jgi:hypothetical protein